MTGPPFKFGAAAPEIGPRCPHGRALDDYCELCDTMLDDDLLEDLEDDLGPEDHDVFEDLELDVIDEDFD